MKNDRKKSITFHLTAAVFEVHSRISCLTFLNDADFGIINSSKIEKTSISIFDFFAAFFQGHNDLQPLEVFYLDLSKNVFSASVWYSALLFFTFIAKSFVF